MNLMQVDYKSTAKNLNQVTFLMYYEQLTLIVLSLFKYTNLPNSIKGEWIEKYLFKFGECMFFEDDTLGLMVSKCAEEEINHYEEPVNLNPVATNYSNSKSYKNGKEAVLIKNNLLSTPTEKLVRLFAYRLTNITRSQDININAQKTPVLIKCRNNQRLTLKNMYSQYEGNEPAIFGDKEADLDGFGAIKTDAPVVFDKLQTQKHQVMNEFLTFIGVNNANMDKKERLVANEVESNNESVVCFGNTLLEAREEAIKEINKIFGLNIKVERRSNTELISEVLKGSEGGSEND